MTRFPFGPDEGRSGTWHRLSALSRAAPGSALRELLQLVDSHADLDPLWVADILEDVLQHGDDTVYAALMGELRSNQALRPALELLHPDTGGPERSLAIHLLRNELG